MPPACRRRAALSAASSRRHATRRPAAVPEGNRRQHSLPLSARLLPLAVVGEGALALAGGSWLYAGGHAVRLGAIGPGILAGLGGAAAFIAVQAWLQYGAPRIGPVRQLRQIQRCVFQPLFAPLSIAELVAISALAGVGEEIFFRGAVQSAFGWPIATIAFGLCHLGVTRRSWVLGVWATAAGAALAALAIATNGLVAPIVAHAVYDLAALVWLKHTAHRAARGGA
jgi:CAAX protease family protein